MPDAKDRCLIVNVDEVKQFLSTAPDYGVYIKVAGLTIPISNKHIGSARDNPIYREVAGYSIDQFIEFLERKQVSAQISYTIRGTSIESMVDDLEKAEIVKSVRGDRIKASYTYYIGDVHVMSGWDERGWETRIYDKELIMTSYQNLRGSEYNIKEDMTNVTKTLDIKM
jgi:hypothetical protein